MRTMAQLFSKWKVDQLTTFLKKKKKEEFFCRGEKPELAEKAYYTWKLKLEVTKTTREDEDDVSMRGREKVDHRIDCLSSFSQ